MKEISVHAFKHGVTIHTEDVSEMRREHLNLSYREAQLLQEELTKVLSHPSHRGILSVPSKKTTPVLIEEDGPHLRIINGQRD